MDPDFLPFRRFLWPRSGEEGKNSPNKRDVSNFPSSWWGEFRKNHFDPLPERRGRGISEDFFRKHFWHFLWLLGVRLAQQGWYSANACHFLALKELWWVFGLPHPLVAFGARNMTPPPRKKNNTPTLTENFFGSGKFSGKGRVFIYLFPCRKAVCTILGVLSEVDRWLFCYFCWKKSRGIRYPGNLKRAIEKISNQA